MMQPTIPPEQPEIPGPLRGAILAGRIFGPEVLRDTAGLLRLITDPSAAEARLAQIASVEAAVTSRLVDVERRELAVAEREGEVAGLAAKAAELADLEQQLRDRARVLSEREAAVGQREVELSQGTLIAREKAAAHRETELQQREFALVEAQRVHDLREASVVEKLAQIAADKQRLAQDQARIDATLAAFSAAASGVR